MLWGCGGVGVWVWGCGVGVWEMGGGGSPCRMSIIRNVNVALSNLRKCRVACR